LLGLVAEANTRYLTFLDRELIGGVLVQRDENVRVLAALQGGGAKRGVIVTGGAGSGKSTVLLHVIRSLQQQGFPVLAFRIDRLEPTQLPVEAGRQMGLPTSPVAALTALAKGRPCVLVLDQLDAVSLMSGRNPSFFECFDEMVRQALALPEMRVVVACRRFDLQNDQRLRRLGGCEDAFETVDVGPLPENAVRQIVTAMGINAARLSAHQIRLLSVPAHLKLLAEATRENPDGTLSFQTANDLYALFWRQKQAVLSERLGRLVEWTAVVDALCEYMDEHQSLSAPEAVLDAHAQDTNAMISEHVLVHDGKRIAFFHEGFFDYAFARRFAARNDDLLRRLRSGEQHLFRRAQVRQVLLHEREADRAGYLRDLKALLTSADIRFHIKQVVFALLAQCADPTEEEWRILEGLLAQPDWPHRREIWFAVRTLPWFGLLDSLGVVAVWLRHTDSDTVDNAVVLLRRVQGDAADRVAELVEPYVGASDEWRRRFGFLVQWADLAAGRRFFDLFLRLIDSGDLDHAGRFTTDDFLGLLHDLPEKRPTWACEAIGHYLQRRLSITISAGQTNPFADAGGLRHSQSSEQVLIGSAQAAPQSFVEHVLPFVLRVIELNAVREDETPQSDAVWRWRHRHGGHGVDDHVLRATEEALRKLAAETPDEFDRVAASLRQSEYETVQFLLIRAYAAHGSHFADHAVDYLCGSLRRLSVGYSGSPYGAARELIAAASASCSAEQLARLESVLLGYYPDCERTAGRQRWRGSAQFELLLAIDEACRSAAVESRIGEWQRKFGVEAPPESQFRTGVFHAGSPIPTSAAEKMSDEQWLGAIAHYAGGRDYGWRDGKPVGGTHELSQVLEAQARNEPRRFARLVLRFPDDTHAAYFDAVLRGLDSGVAHAEALFDACRRCHRLPKRPVGSAFCRLVEKLPELTWPGELLDAVEWYATEDPDPDKELWRTEASGGQCFYGGDIHMAGINCVRGAAADAVRALLFADPNRLKRFLPVLGRMVRDPLIAVRSCVAAALHPVLNQDRDLAVQLFLELCDTDDVLLKTHCVEEFMMYATGTHFAQLRPVIERMFRSSDPEVAQAGARRACVASLGLEEATDLVALCMAGSEPLRTGAAQVFAANLGQACFRSACEPRLVRLFNDLSEDVRAAAAECFNHLEGAALGQLTDLVGQFVQSAAFAAHHERLIRALEKTTARLPDVTLDVCRRFLDTAGEAAGDIRSRASLGAGQVSDLLLRTYHQAEGQAIRSRCLDLMDQLLSAGVTELNRALAEFDR
jgi:hypothetical protein